MVCPKCKAQLPPGAILCGKCGTKFKTKTCPHCKSTILSTLTVCPHCHLNVNQPSSVAKAQAAKNKPKKPLQKQWWFWTLCVVLSLGIIGSIGNAMKEDSKTSTRSKSSSISQHDENAVKSDNSKEDSSLVSTSEPAKELSEIEKRETTKALDTEIMSICSAADKDYAAFLALFSKEELSVADIYNDAKSFKEVMRQHNKNINAVKAIETESCKQYKDSAIIYVYSMLDVAKKAIKYLDNPDATTMAKIQETTEQVSNYCLVVAKSRIAFLADSGFSDAEINDIVDSTVAMPEPTPESTALEKDTPSDSVSDTSSGGINNFDTYDNPDQQQTNATYVLNTNTMKFHFPSCKDVKKIAPDNYAEFVGTRDEAKAKGYSPCGHCNP